MTVCTVADVKAVINTYTLSDEEIQSVINSAHQDIYDKTGSTDESKPDMKLAIRFTAYAYTLRKMKTTGELAASVKIGNDTRQNSPDKDIQTYEEYANYHVRKFLDAAQYDNFDGIFGRSGYGTVNNTL